MTLAKNTSQSVDIDASRQVYVAIKKHYLTAKEIIKKTGLGLRQVQRRLRAGILEGKISVAHNSNPPKYHLIVVKKHARKSPLDVNPDLWRKMKKAVKDAYFDMVDGDDTLLFEEDAKRYPGTEFVSMTLNDKVEGILMTGDEGFIHRIAAKMGMPPDDPNFKKTLWKVFKKNIIVLYSS